MDSVPFSKHPEWPTVLHIVKTLNSHGHQAVLAGGCVRDALLGKKAKDLDVATDATPDQIETYFPRVLPLGKSFGVCRVVHEGASIEVATFRQEFDYRDGRRPSQVEFSSLEKDAERRDFTVNALFYDVAAEKMLDSVGGIEDLHKKIIRAVGDADRRLSEDYLRILRGVRFAGQLNFKIEEKTYDALKSLAQYLPRISRERIYDELNKMFSPEGLFRCFELLREFRIFEYILPDWDLDQKLQTFSEPVSLTVALRRLSGVKSESSVYAWVALYHLRSQQMSGKALDKEFLDLKLPRVSIDTSKAILEAAAVITATGDKAVLAYIAAEVSGFLDIAIQYWDGITSTDRFSKKIFEFRKMFYREGRLPEPLVTGHDLIKMGWPQGPGMKDQLQSLYLQQLQNSEMKKDELLRLIVRARGLS